MTALETPTTCGLRAATTIPASMPLFHGKRALPALAPLWLLPVTLLRLLRTPRMFEPAFTVPSTVPLLEKFSEFVKVRNSTVSDDVIITAEDRTQCPHKGSGLSDWHTQLFGEANSDVTLPNNTKALISSMSLDPKGYRQITIPETSELIFADAPIFLRAQKILVRGKLLIGSMKCPIHSPVTITLFDEKLGAAGFGNGRCCHFDFS